MRRISLLAFAFVTLAYCANASAQDFGSSWIDRVTHELIEEGGPLSPHPVEYNASAGLLFSYDNNIFLTNTNRTASGIIIPFASASLKYAQPNFDAAADLTVNYNAYTKNSTFDADEERFFGRARYQGSAITLQVAEVFRHESSPSDAVVVTRVPRTLSDTTPLIIWHAAEVFAVELQSDLQFVNFHRQLFETADNFNSRSLATLAYTTGKNNIDLLLQGGYFTISYHDPSSPPGATGYVARGGIRGELSTNLHIIALAGYTHAESDALPITGTKISTSTADIELHLAYNPNENMTVYADYSRRFGWSADGAPFEIVNSSDLIGQFSVRDDLKLRARLQYDRVNAPGGLRRAYYSVGAGAEYKIHPNIVIDGGVTYRWGVVPGVGGVGNFGDVIFTIGAAVVF
jgi:hypothetical protein